MASGQALLYFDPTSGKPGDADYATRDTILTTSADEPDNVIDVLDFDPGSTEEYIYFRAVMPDGYSAATGVTLTIDWTSEATTGDVIWSAAFKRFADSVNVVTTAFSAPNDAAALTTDGTARDVNVSTITFTAGADMASVVAGDSFWIEFHRSSADASDTMNSNDAELHGFWLKDT